MTTSEQRPRVCSVAGTDSGGGAGLSADQRAAEAFEVHLCPVVAAVTAQHSRAVQRVDAMDPTILRAQLDALAEDLPPAVVKTGLLGSAANVRVLAAWLDEQREHRPLPLVVDPVLRASTGASLAGSELITAYRELLLPRATIITPNRREAAALLGLPEASTAGVPAQAAALRALGAATVLVTGGDATDALALDWLESTQARGWLSLPREQTPHTHGTGCTFATAAAAALAHGFPEADAAVLAKMLTTHAVRHGYEQGSGAGPVHAGGDWSRDRSLLPHLTEEPPRAWPPQRAPASIEGLYGIVDSPERALEFLRPGSLLRHLQVRAKAPPEGASTAFLEALEAGLRRCVPAAAGCGVTLWVNDHWRSALASGAPAVHLGQEDLLALSADDRAELARARSERGLLLGLSSHTLWELCRAVALRPDYLACGPVWPTTTKTMPWTPQGLDNLAWWAALAPVPVVAVGGILEPGQAELAAEAGAAAVCLVRALAEGVELAPWQAAFERGRAGRATVPRWPHPAL